MAEGRDNILKGTTLFFVWHCPTLVLVTFHDKTCFCLFKVVPVKWCKTKTAFRGSIHSTALCQHPSVNLVFGCNSCGKKRNKSLPPDYLSQLTLSVSNRIWPGQTRLWPISWLTNLKLYLDFIWPRTLRLQSDCSLTVDTSHLSSSQILWHNDTMTQWHNDMVTYGPMTQWRFARSE